MCPRRPQRAGQVQLPLPQRHRVPAALPHLRLVVQRGLQPRRGPVLSQPGHRRGEGGCWARRGRGQREAWPQWRTPGGRAGGGRGRRRRGSGLGLSRQIRVRICYNKLSWQSVRTSRIWIQIQSLCTPCEGVIIGTETCSHQRSPRSQERTVLLPLPRPQQRLRGCRLPRLRWPGSLRSRRLLHTQQRRRGLLGFL